jgi:hypothetical protein
MHRRIVRADPDASILHSRDKQPAGRPPAIRPETCANWNARNPQAVSRIRVSDLCARNIDAPKRAAAP